MIRIYQVFVSPFLHFLVGPTYGCRYHPTCSEYSKECYRRFGFFKATWLTLLRVLSCHPFSNRWPYDDVPKPN